MSKFDLKRSQEIWQAHLGFPPTAFASFDHIATGFPSRILVGYERFKAFCEEHKTDEFRAVSIVLDTIIPEREVPCGISPELGFVPNDKTVWIANREQFFFRNNFDFRFGEIREDFHRALSKSLNGCPKEKRWKHYHHASGWFEVFAQLWGEATTCEDVMKARRDLHEILGLTFRGKRRLFSNMLSAVADVLEDIERQGISFSECPGTEKVGFVRLVSEEGREGETVFAWDHSLIDLIRNKQAVPAAPLAIAATSLPFPHCGNDYGYLQLLCEWLGLDRSFLRTLGDDKNSWPVGTLKVPASQQIIHSVWTHLMRFPKYSDLVTAAVQAGGPVFSEKLGSWS
jgi:hypothetical protein